MNINLQPILENERAILYPLKEEDFEALYQVASDPKVWEQHPNFNRYQKPVFENFFRGAIESLGAFKIVDKETGEIAGSTRFYDYDENRQSILIGYTFYATKFWGTGLNPSVKNMMLDYIFQFVETVIFHVGENNIRSRKAIERIGGVLVDKINVAYYGEPERTNVVFEIKKSDYEKIQNPK